MSIRYSLFEFATLPGTGASWFVQACQYAGFGPSFLNYAHIPFSESVHSSKLRVSLVRHPCSWLAHCFVAKKSNLVPLKYMGGFADSPLDNFDSFVEDYLNRMPGAVTTLYRNYQADTFIRIEDMPGAFHELMESFGVPRTLYGYHVRTPIQNNNLPEWNPKLRALVAKQEMSIIDEYDYIA